ncbi:MAG TPA: L-threonine 3-dehydrogenase [Candidatus Bilamarchaeaceae archaeon]|nr:L-threonine 3-dehydrogenase [Candidatus Bilamarchaeaceae archaeon]
MLSVWKTEPKKGLEVKDTGIPKIAEDEVLIKVKATSICGTDRHIYNWDNWAQNRISKTIPYIFGHEVSGEIVELGKQVRGLEIGDHVSAETHISCGYCYQCKTGNEHVCENVKILGVDTQGTFAEYLKLPYRNAWKNDKSIPHWVATAQEPLGNAVHTVFDGEVAGKNMVVLGDGPIGICAVALCKIAGAESITLIGHKDFRLKLGKEFGADHIINSKNEDTQKRLKEIYEKGADAILEISGSENALNDGIACLKAGGRISVLGVFKENVRIDINKLVFGSIKLNGINGRKMFDTWYKTSSFLRTKKVQLEKLVTHKFKLKDIEKGFQELDGEKAIKVVLEP